MEWFTEPFTLAFQQRALLGGILAAVMTSVVGTWLVLRGMSFFGDAFVHGVIPGIAAAVVLDLNPLVGAALAAAVMVFAIELVNRQTVLGEGHVDRPSLRRDVGVGCRDHFAPGLLLRVVDQHLVRRCSRCDGIRPGRAGDPHRGRGERSFGPLPTAALVEFQCGEGGAVEHEAQESTRCPAGPHRRCGDRKLPIRRHTSRFRSSYRSHRRQRASSLAPFLG